MKASYKTSIYSSMGCECLNLKMLIILHVFILSLIEISDTKNEYSLPT